MKIIATDGKIITGDNFPSIQIGDKLYPVDNRMSTYKKIKKIDYLSESIDPDEEMLKLALGKENAKEIIDMDLSVESFSNLTFIVMSAITGEDAEKLKEQAQSAAKN
ncbi:MAG: hypothetical protein IJU45_05920 [Clostridia bacterium]|nr:hypothetical protein [Clostridia bacterium]